MRTGFDEPYTVLTLPRIPDLPLSEKVVIAPLTSPDALVIDIGISKAAISSYVVRPTPKLVWSYALSRSTVVDSLDVSTDSLGSKIYVAGVTERKKSRLLLLTAAKPADATERTDAAPADIGVATTLELEVPSPICGVKVLKNGLAIIMVLSDGSVQLVSNSENKLQLLNINYNMTKLKVKSKTSLVYHEFITDIEVNHAQLGNKDILLQLVKQGDSYFYNLVSLNTSTGFFGINSKPMVGACSRFDISYCANTIYQLNRDTHQVTMINATTLEQVKELSVASVCGDDKNACIIAAAPNRIVLSLSNKITLVNVQFSSISGTCVIPQGDEAMAILAVKVAGNSQRSSRSTLCFLDSNAKANSVKLCMVDMNVGTNTLRESLGKAMTQESGDSPKFHGLSSLVSPHFEAEAHELANETEVVFESLIAQASSKQIDKWERIAVPYFKGESWPSIHKSISKTLSKAAKIHEFREFDVDNDRQLDVSFVTHVLSLVFDVDEHQGTTFADPAFVPEYTIVYLLTHSLFPKKFSRGLLELFRSSGKEILLRQAIITCPNLPLTELLAELIHGCKLQAEADTFEDCLNRLINEFSPAAIANALRLIRDNAATDSDYTLDMDMLLNRLLQIKGNNNSWHLIELVIDIGGLFTWSSSTVEKLGGLVETKITKLMQNSRNLTLVNQALLLSDPLVKKRNKRKGKKEYVPPVVGGEIVAANSQEKARLASFLTMKNSTLAKGDGADFTGKLPLYMIEKLQL